VQHFRSFEATYPFKIVGGGRVEATVNYHTLNTGQKTGVATFGTTSYYDCLNLRNAWRKRHGLPIQGYWNPGHEGLFSGKETADLNIHALIIGREIALKMIVHVLDDLPIVLFLPPNSQVSINRTIGKDEAKKNFQKHLASMIGLGIRASLEVEGFEVHPICYVELRKLSQEHIESLPSEFNAVVLDDHIVKGDTLYQHLIPEVLKTMVNLGKTNFTINVFTYFALLSGLDKLKNGNGWTRYGFSPRKPAKASASPIDYRIKNGLYTELITKHIGENELTLNEIAYLQERV
jgi:hypothetical protein